MASFVEANSLSSITQLAGNPPKYPRNPTEQQRQPLVLYIARVPGSRDIILTTMKPRLKNVTADDVASSLYYLHFDLPEDNLLVGSEGEEEDYKVFRPRSRDSTIPRKPLRQESTIPSLFDIASAPPLPPRPGLDQTQMSRRDPMMNRNEDEYIANTSTSLNTFVDRKPLPAPPLPSTAPRRPLGPRPNLAPSQLNRKPHAGQENRPLNTESQEPIPSAISMTQPSTNSTKSNTVLNSEESASAEMFSITLIRRDPSSGAQWNIGKVKSYQTMEEPYSNTGDRSKRERSSPSYLVHLDTLGYGQFKGSQIASNTSKVTAAVPYPESSSTTHTGFDRHIHMEGSSFWERGFKTHQRGSSDQSSSRVRTRTRSNSDLLTSMVSGKSELDSTSLAKPKGRGYVFMSPWNGRCEFSTGSGGRTLKCKHRLQSPTSIIVPSVSFSTESAPVSELRFNLPSAAIFNTRSASPTKLTGHTNPVASKLHHIRNKLSSSTHLGSDPQPPNNSYAAMYPHDDDDQGVYDRLDLSLGKEKAGGGNRGGRAKLGKLIVQGEGLKMLDLVVAANMAIWWGIWERS